MVRMSEFSKIENLTWATRSVLRPGQAAARLSMLSLWTSLLTTLLKAGCFKADPKAMVNLKQPVETRNVQGLQRTF